MEVIRIENFNFSYPKQDKLALRDINIDIKEGEFVLLCGQSGCGKTTLLKQLKPQLTPHGKFSGEIKYLNKNIKDYEEIKTSCEIGYVMQDCNAQIVTDKVWHELAFGLENMGVDTQSIRRRVAEMASFFGIQGWFRKNVNELSGGQKQLLNLAAIMVMNPKILILDEPTSQLDPIASKNFLDTIVKINRELGTTIIITEHQLEDIFSVADRVLVMEKGSTLCFDTPQRVVKKLGENNNKHSMFKALPTSVRIYNEVPYGDNCPLTVKEGKVWLNSFIKDTYIEDNEEVAISKKDGEDIVLELKDVWFKYNKLGDATLRNLSLKIYKGEMYCILGGNGVGKTTTLAIMSKERKPLRGKVLINNIDIKKYEENKLFKENLAVLPQNPQSLFAFDTLKEDLMEISINFKHSKEEFEKRVLSMAETFGITDLLNQHPYDLSGGELQKAAMAKIMLLNPKILLLDEPTKGLDAYSKEELGHILLSLKNKGITIVMVTHDIEFSARYGDRCSLFFDGAIVSEGAPREFFSSNNFYTTSASRMARHISPKAITEKDVVNICKIKNLVKG